jgi:N-acetyl-S-(2-succino)cysteine monooxygenase
VFTAHSDLRAAQEFATGLRSRLAEAGRSPDEVRIMPGLQPFIGRTRAEAEAKHELLQSLIDPVVGLGLITP